LDGFVFNNTGTTAITSGGTDRTITLGAGGITVNSGAGAVSIGVNSAGNKIYFNLSAPQSWINNGSGTLSIPGARHGGDGAGAISIGGPVHGICPSTAAVEFPKGALRQRGMVECQHEGCGKWQ
jgi:hypothetical protein